MNKEIHYKFPLYMRVCSWAELDRETIETSSSAFPCRGFVIDAETNTTTDCGVIFHKTEHQVKGHYGSIVIEPLKREQAACRQYAMGWELLVDALLWTR